MAPRARTLVLPLAAATVLIASTIFLFAAAGARWRPADTGLPVPAAAAPFSVVPVSVNSSTDGQELSFVDENGRPDDPNASSAAGRCDPSAAAIRVFMYDMPPEFHFGLLDWVPPAGEVGSVWTDVRSGAAPHYPDGLNQQHSVEYWLTLDLLSSSSQVPSASSAIDFLTLCYRLKTTKRAGWVRRGVQGPESVADHMYRMGVMALVAADLPGVDRDRCVKMAIVHDIAEGS